MTSKASKPIPLPKLDFLERIQIKGLHAESSRVYDRVMVYHPTPKSMGYLNSALLLQLLRIRPIGVVRMKKDGTYQCISSFLLYHRLMMRSQWSTKVPVLIFEKIRNDEISRLAEVDLFFAPYIAGPSHHSKEAHADQWEELQKQQLVSSLKPEVSGMNFFAKIANFPRRRPEVVK